MKRVFAFAVLVCLAVVAAGAQDKKTTGQAKAHGVTINMPESGISHEQADAILLELKAIHALLERQQQARAPQPQAPPQPERVKMKLNAAYVLGRADAPVTVVEFSDYQCPFCRRFHTSTFEELKKKYIDTGKLRVVAYDLPLEFHNNALKAAQSARCAGEQNKFWEMRHLLIDNQRELGPDAIAKYAEQLKLDMNAFRACTSGEKYLAEIRQTAADANAAGISGTPSFVLGKTSNDELEGVVIVGALPIDNFDSQIRPLLGGN